MVTNLPKLPPGKLISTTVHKLVSNWSGQGGVYPACYTDRILRRCIGETKGICNLLDMQSGLLVMFGIGQGYGWREVCYLPDTLQATMLHLRHQLNPT